MNKAIDEFRQDKNSFLCCIMVCATVWFLAVCILFGLYIYRSFDNQVYMSQDLNGNYNIQEMNK
jgi:hypothetical protein